MVSKLKSHLWFLSGSNIDLLKRKSFWTGNNIWKYFLEWLYSAQLSIMCPTLQVIVRCSPSQPRHTTRAGWGNIECYIGVLCTVHCRCSWDHSTQCSLVLTGAGGSSSHERDGELCIIIMWQLTNFQCQSFGSIRVKCVKLSH